MTESPTDTEQAADPKKPGEESDEDILKESRDRYRQCTDAESVNRNDMLDDLQFLSGGLNQWEPEAARIRTAERRPCLTVNNLPTFLHQVTNEQRQNKPGVKVHPVDDNADIETAEVLQGLIRHIEYDSNADVAYDRAVNSAAGIGIGWFRLVTEYEAENSFDQKIMFKSIRNALSVHIDPLSQEPDGSDMKFAFIDSLEPRKEFEKAYPDANASSTSLIGQEMYAGWLAEDTVLVCEYYRIKATPATLCELEDGSKGWKDELPKALHRLIKRERESARCVVEWFKITGADILERTEIKCKWIPVFPVYGDEIDINGKVVRSGIIRNAKDPFRMYNYWITCATEEVSLRPKSPYIIAEGQDEGYEDMWATANTRSYSALPYKPTTVEGLLVPAPQRQPMADVPTGMLAMAMHAADNKKATTGLFDSSLGARGTATSGIQERAQQHQGDVANFHYTDNLNITVRHVGRCIVNMAPHYYDAPRTIRILGEDDSATPVKINQPVEEKNPKTGAIETVTRDLTVGTFDVTVNAGPSYSTKRQEAAEFLTSAMQAAKDPATASVVTYLSFKNQDLPGADEATKMLKKLLPPNVVEPEEGDEPTVMTPKGPVPVSQAGKVIEEMGMALQNADKAMDQIQGQAEKNKEAELALREEATKLEAERSSIEAAKREFQLTEKLAHETLNAREAQTEAEATKIIAEMKILVNDAVTRLEGMKQQAVESKAGEDGAAVAAKNIQAEAKNQEINEMQQALLTQLTQALTLLAAPRKTTLQNDANGVPVAAVSEII